MRDKIIVVDNNEIHRAAISRILKEDYTIEEVEDGAQALELLTRLQDEIAAILVDMLVSQGDGFSFLRTIQESPLHSKIPVVVVCNASSAEIEKQLFDCGISECISQPFDEKLIRIKVNNIVKLFQYQNELEEKIKQQTQRLQMQNHMLKTQADFLQKSNLQIIDLLGAMAEYRDLESGEHIKRIKVYTKIVAEQVMKDFPDKGLTPEKVSVIVSASSLHDIGKIAITDTVLLKPGKLTEKEYEYMKSHTICGCEIVEKLKDAWSREYGKISAEICRSHHERYDGNGYPDGLEGDEIPISAQIVAIADVYDALVHERVYKMAVPKNKAYEMIMNGECGAFSPDMLQCLTNCKKALEAV